MQHAARGAHGLIDGVCAASREHSGCTRGCGGALPVQARHAPPSCCVEWIGAHLNVDGGDGRSEERRDDVHASRDGAGDAAWLPRLRRRCMLPPAAPVELSTLPSSAS